MSGPDETFVPPEEEEEKPPPHPPTPAPPHFGRGSGVGQPSVVFQPNDTRPSVPISSRTSVASDAEETMTPHHPKRPGTHTPDASPPTRAPFETLPDDEAPSQDAGSRPQS